ncbi:unnamed protein product [Linum trigynum]|uniref:Uncharacterized protein n=1 Tax=Linum trigynum TaxID=586398 RepID=A0AAV2DX68_9ROSI
MFSSLFSTYSESIVYHELPIESDHSPLRLEFEGPKRKAKKSFRFDARWLQSEECYEIVNRNWDEGGLCQDRMTKCEKELEKWAKQMYLDQNKIVCEIQKRIEEILLMEQTQDIIDEEKSIMNELVAIWKDEELFWR